MKKYITTPEAIEYFGVSTHTLKYWRTGCAQYEAQLIEGVHWMRCGERSVLFNVPMMEDWLANHRVNPEAHQRAIAAYRRSLPSGQVRTK